SQTLQGAGGVGGLLSCSSASSSLFVAYDGNGNVAALVDADTGTVTAQYDYSPFGETVRAVGPAASENPFRFSTKYAEPAAGSELYYYGYRYYSPELGRWSRRDPVEETGGIGLYSFVGNSVMARIDHLGMAIWPWEPWPYDPDPEDDIGPGTTPGDICKKKQECPSCKPVPAGARYGQHTHDSHDHFMKHLGATCFELFGSKTHWHFFEMHQAPYPNCTCRTIKRDGGCGGAPTVIPPIPW
ncbi:MAG: hypothetical protein JXR77_17055, partial [Lentisphaeria bacterium]|nr:hypothetical protein [Lentisphaeria bacterium]